MVSARPRPRLRSLWLVLALVAIAGLASAAGAAAKPTAKPRAFAAAPATAAFGLDLLRQLPASGSLVFSPDSVATAMSMAGAGARGTTARQIADGLRLRSPHAFAQVGVLQRTLAAEQAAAAGSDPDAPTLGIANGLFVQQGYPLGSLYLATLAGPFGAAPQSVDFTTPAAADAINDFVSSHTHGVIPQIVQHLDPSTRLALANAIYLKAKWATPFAAESTRPAPFHASGGDVTAPFMHRTDPVSYGTGRGYAAVELPYRSSPLALLVVLPVGQSERQLERSLTGPALGDLVAGLVAKPVQLSLPRFHVALRADLIPPLRALGITQAFSPAADFSGITSAERLTIGSVQHAADFTVDEDGTVAAAATVVTVVPTSAAPIAEPVPFTANRPFLFLLRDTRTGAVLFAGRLARPS